jgi:crossover junction endodeoxyribonuclease RusA
MPVTRRALVPPAPTPPKWDLDVLGTPVVAVAVPGSPAPQGSKAYKGHVTKTTKSGKAVRVPVLVEQVAGVGPWREAVAGAVPLVLPRPWTPLDGPIVADMIFTMSRGASLPAWRDWHSTCPDLDKLVRATCDALTTCGAWVDDGRLTGFRRLDAVHVGSDDPDALPHPGAVIRLWPVPQHLIEARKARTRRRAAR